jgi:NAD(P)-dependent dehydrogenase (short-subunit alcohol dehydrogenase family)
MTLTGKSALITGSLGGIGFATAKALAEQGCDITLNGFAAPETIEARLTDCAIWVCGRSITGPTCVSPPRSPR